MMRVAECQQPANSDRTWQPWRTRDRLFPWSQELMSNPLRSLLLWCNLHASAWSLDTDTCVSFMILAENAPLSSTLNKRWSLHHGAADIHITFHRNTENTKSSPFDLMKCTKAFGPVNKGFQCLVRAQAAPGSATATATARMHAWRAGRRMACGWIAAQGMHACRPRSTPHHNKGTAGACTVCNTRRRWQACGCSNSMLVQGKARQGGRHRTGVGSGGVDAQTALPLLNSVEGGSPL